MDKFAVILNLIFVSTIHIRYTEEAQFKCPPGKRGDIEDPIQCDKYYKCEKNVTTEQLCPDGLVFGLVPGAKTGKCDYPFKVDCGSRTELQKPKPAPSCKRQNGYFPHPDETVCNVYYICTEGKAFEMKCSKGLHFDEFGGGCVLPESADRSDCADDISVVII